MGRIEILKNSMIKKEEELNRRKVVAHRYAHLIPTKEQSSKYIKIYNELNKILNK